MNNINNSHQLYNCEIIAEVANSHCGNYSKIKKLIKSVANSGCVNIKFQIFKPDELVTKKHKDFSLLKDLCFSRKQWFDIADLCKNYNLNIYFDVFDIESLRLAVALKPEGYKIHSTNIDDELFVKTVSTKTNKLILSTGGSYFSEIENAIKWSVSANDNIVIFLMSGIQNFPTLLSDTNLGKIFNLKTKFKKFSNIRFGLQDHISGDDKMAFLAPFIARAMKYDIIEKHITLDRSKKEIDYFSSLNPDEFSSLIDNWNKFDQIVGPKNNSNDSLTNQEINYRLFSKKYAVAKHELKKGMRLKDKHIMFKRTGMKTEGLNRKSILKYINKIIKKDIKEDGVIDGGCF